CKVRGHAFCILDPKHPRASSCRVFVLVRKVAGGSSQDSSRGRKRSGRLARRNAQQGLHSSPKVQDGPRLSPLPFGHGTRVDPNRGGQLPPGEASFDPGRFQSSRKGGSRSAAGGVSKEFAFF